MPAGGIAVAWELRRSGDDARADAAGTPLSARPFETLLEAAVAFHGHLCPGQVLGVRMTLAGCRELAIADPKVMGKNLVVFAEIDRCATDAIQALTGVSVGKRTLKLMDYGKMAATFVVVGRYNAVRIVARDEARTRASAWAPLISGDRAIQIAAYRVMPEAALLSIAVVRILPGWLDRRRVRVACESCGEGINYQREIRVDGRTVCRPCAGDRYYIATQ